MNPLKYQMLQVKPVVDIGHRGMQEITTLGTGGGGGAPLTGIISTICGHSSVFIFMDCNINTDLKPQRNREMQHRACI